MALAITLAGGSTAVAAPAKGEWVAITSFYNVNNNLTMTNSATSRQLPADANLELALRIRGPFSLTGAFIRFMEPPEGNTQVLQSRLRGWGAGFKVDIPGFLFMGTGHKTETAAKNYPINSYLFGQFEKIDATEVVSGATTSGIITRQGLGFDVFLFNPSVYLALRIGVLNYLGDAYTNFGAGLGISL